MQQNQGADGRAHVYVLNADGGPLMPTSPAKARRLLKAKRAKVARRTPFTIQMRAQCRSCTQPVAVGLDAGHRHMGLSATSHGEELLAAEAELRGGQVAKNVEDRAQLRRSRRSRKWHRKPRFDHRARAEGWLAPSTEADVRAHVSLVRLARALLPVTSATVETAQFDVAQMRAWEEGRGELWHGDYQKGTLKGWENVKAYVRARDSHACQLCHGRSKDGHLEVHHVHQRRDGGSDRPDNLVTLCRTCHARLHKGELSLPEARSPKTLASAAFMNVMRPAVLKRLHEELPEIEVTETTGAATKAARLEHKLEKSHAVDARCISGDPAAVPSSRTYRLQKLRRHNRQTHRANPRKGRKGPNRGQVRQRAQAPFSVQGFQLMDKVLYLGSEYFVKGRRSSGRFSIAPVQGGNALPSVGCRKLQLLERSRGFAIS